MKRIENNYIQIYQLIIYKNMIKVKRNNYIKIYRLIIYKNMIEVNSIKLNKIK